VGKIRIGSPDYLSVQPLIYGLAEQQQPQVELVHAEPGELATALEQERLDVALVPSIEFLRGVGRHYFIEGPGLVIRGRTGGIILVTDRPVEKINRVAVGENSRTSVAVLRILLDKVHGALPDFCVFKAEAERWRDDYDAILLTGDEGLRYCSERMRSDETCYDLGEMWCELYPSPLTSAMWVYNDDRITRDLRDRLIEVRDNGVRELSLLADGAATGTGYDSQFIYDYLSRGWSYNIGQREENGLKLLEEAAFDYQLIQHRRLGKVLTGQS
jgi:chorismate dehydratase